MLKATFKGIKIKEEGWAGWLLGQDGLSTKIWLSCINMLGRQRPRRMQSLFAERKTIIKI